MELKLNLQPAIPEVSGLRPPFSQKQRPLHLAFRTPIYICPRANNEQRAINNKQTHKPKNFIVLGRANCWTKTVNQRILQRS